VTPTALSRKENRIMRVFCVTVLTLVVGLCGAKTSTVEGGPPKIPENVSVPEADREAVFGKKVGHVGFSRAEASTNEETPPKVSEKVSVPELEFAAAVAKKVDRDEAAWQELTVKLAKAVETYNPSSVHVMPEGQSLDAFRQYCVKLLESGRSLVVLHEKWNKASDGLGDSLRKAPAYYRSASLAMREKAEKARFAVIKERYILTADIWEQLALRAEERSKDLSLDQGSRGVVDLIREENMFLDDFITTLNAVPRISGEDSGRYGELIEVLRKHAQKSDELHRQLKLFRDKLKASPEEGAATSK
jgi:hypothetical protein